MNGDAKTIKVKATYRKLPTASTLKALWHRAADRGDENFHDQAGALLHRVSNRVTLYTLVVNTLSIFTYATLLFFFFDRSLVALLAAGLIIEGLLVLMYTVKTRPHKKATFNLVFSVAYLAGIFYIGFFVTSIQEFAGYHCLYGILALPFFFLPREELWLIVLLELISGGVILMVALTDLLHFGLVVPAALQNPFYLVLNILSFTGITTSLYFFWIISIRPR